MTRRAVTLTLLLALAGLIPWARSADAGQLLAEVYPGWSPFARSAVPRSVTPLVTEARALMPDDPARVAEILGQSAPGEPAAERVLAGLHADALYFVGGNRLFDAQRGYRSLVTGAGSPEEVGWAHFMIGNIHKAMGFWKEAEVEYRAAVDDPPGPWTAALQFNLGALFLETARHAEARAQFSSWIAAHPGEPGKALVLYLLGEAEAALGLADAARERFEAALGLEPEAWIARPEVGYAMADGFLRAGDAERAAAILGQVVERYPGTEEAGRARLETGRVWEARDDVRQAATAYARLLDERPTSAEGSEALLRLALLGVEHADRVELSEPLPALRYFYRPRPTLEKVADGRDPVAAQRALRGLAEIETKAGKSPSALSILARVFEDYPESPESGRAYEGFMDLLGVYLEELSEAGDHARLVLVYEAFRRSIQWVPTRDAGELMLQVAQAYGALGAPDLARAVYEKLLATGTRALGPEQLRRRILGTEVAAGDAEALRAWVRENPENWDAQLVLARELAAAGQGAEARKVYLAALRAAPEVADRLQALVEADRVAVASAEVADLLRSLGARRDLWRALEPGEERRDWEAHDLLMEARLQFALGSYQEALRHFESLPAPAPADLYFLALAELHSGRKQRARERLRALVGEEDRLVAGLAELQLKLMDLDGGLQGQP